MEAARYYDENAVDLRAMVGKVRCPTLVLCGEHDWICGPAWNRPLAQGIAGAEFHVIDGVGHLPQYEAAEEFRSLLFGWCSRTAVATDPSP